MFTLSYLVEASHLPKDRLNGTHTSRVSEKETLLLAMGEQAFVFIHECCRTGRWRRARFIAIATDYLFLFGGVSTER